MLISSVCFFLSSSVQFYLDSSNRTKDANYQRVDPDALAQMDCYCFDFQILFDVTKTLFLGIREAGGSEDKVFFDISARRNWASQR